MRVGILIPTRGAVMQSPRRPPVDECWSMARLAYYGGGVHRRGTMGLGPPDVVAAALGRYAAAGVTDLCIRFIGNDQLAQLERFTAEVLPGLGTAR